ncbi:MAG: hypothetical protein LBL70_03985 [Treponema sp.]|jgi:hypothetical protein|nr:hypothetical protein [Treponema sp.]
MRKPFRLPFSASLVFLLLWIPLMFSCRGTPRPGTGKPWVSDAVPDDNPDNSPGSSGSPGGTPLPEEDEALLWALQAAPGVGIFTGDPRDPALNLAEEERERISLSFRKAYGEALRQGFPLEGVLGGDRVHAWPVSSPLAWVQNWRSAEPYPNSWGLPSLVLAILGINAREVFIVRGAILDAYGKSGGQGGANGVAGYGPPLGAEFVHNGGIAQLFGEGLISVDASGEAAFIPEDRGLVLEADL